MYSEETSKRLHCLGALLVTASLLAGTMANAETVLYFTDIFYPDSWDGHVYCVHTDGSNLQMVLDTGEGVRGIAIDQSAGRLYWTDVEDDVIRCANLDGSAIEDLITLTLVFPMDIDLHPAANLLFWGDQSIHWIGRAQLDGSDAGLLLQTPFGAGIACDTIHDKVYWSTSLAVAMGEILRADLDGTNIETAVTGLGKPGRLALDIAGGKVYWTDHVHDVVRRANLDGTDIEDLYVVGANLNPGGIALDLEAGKVYWGQCVGSSLYRIMRMNLDGSDPEIVLAELFGHITSLALTSSTVNVVESQPLPGLDVGFTVQPNPVTSHAEFTFDFAAPHLELEIYDPQGRLVVTLPATGSVSWIPRRTGASGVYFARLCGVGASEVRKFVVLK